MMANCSAEYLTVFVRGPQKRLNVLSLLQNSERFGASG